MLKISVCIIRQSIATKHKIRSTWYASAVYHRQKKGLVPLREFQHCRGLDPQAAPQAIITYLRTEIKALHTHIRLHTKQKHGVRTSDYGLMNSSPAHLAALAHGKPVFRRTDNLEKPLTTKVCDITNPRRKFITIVFS